MTEERLKEIKDSIELQLMLCKIYNIDDSMIQEEKELFCYAIALKEELENGKIS